MQREPSDSSTGSNSTLRRIGSRLRRIGSKQEKGPISPVSDTPPVQKFVQELDATDTVTYQHPLSSQDGILVDPCYQELKEKIHRLRASFINHGGVDDAFSIYLLHREQALGLCKALLRKHNTIASYLSHESRSLEGHQPEKDVHTPMNTVWLDALQDLKGYQKVLLEDLRTSIASAFKLHEPNASADQVLKLFSKAHRQEPMGMIKSNSGFFVGDETLEYWNSKLRNYDLLDADLHEAESLFAMAKTGKGPTVAIREYDIVTNGDTILEFSNAIPGTHPVLRFRVSSYMLTEVSPFFARVFSSSHSDTNSPLELLESIPPPPLKQVCRDGTEVKVYRMPQAELNKWDALTTLLHAAHMHNDKIPREVEFDEFVSIAEVCLRYQCTSPLEIAVEYLWLPRWVYKSREAFPEGFLLISYVFGLQRAFTYATETVIKRITSDEELESKELWPRDVKDKISTLRQAKLAQIFATCASLMKEYVKLEPNLLVTDGVADTLTSRPKCPRGLHQCDAANLGWLMLVFNELEILPIVLDMVNNRKPSALPNVSVSSLTRSLRKMPSPPQLHSGACDYAIAFRSAMDDIYNTCRGLTLRDVTGKEGWALSKKRDLKLRSESDAHREVFELPAPEPPTPTFPPNRSRGKDAASHDAINLKILSLLDDIQDLHAAAMINKSFYSVLKKNELALMKNIVKAGKRKGSVQTSEGIVAVHQTSVEERDTDSTRRQSAMTTVSNNKPRPLQQYPHEDLHDSSPLAFPASSSCEQVLSPNDVDKILWPHDDHLGNGRSTRCINDPSANADSSDPDTNAKFLTGDIVHVNKSLVIEGRKHLRDVQDQNLRVGPLSPIAQSS